MKKSAWTWCYLIILIIFLFSSICSCERERRPNVPQTVTKKQNECEPESFANGRALSLKKVLGVLSDAEEWNLHQTTIKEFAGITKLGGFILDYEREDVILFGEVGKNDPILRFEDFVLAMRNVNKAYLERKEDTLFYSYPGCSIDPSPKVMAQLDALGEKLKKVKTNSSLNSFYREWVGICTSPQDVKVFGVPFNSHFARTMVKADYDMKSLVDGRDSLNLFGFKSLMQMQIEEEKGISQSRTGQGSNMAGSMNRFWFHPGAVEFLTDETSAIFCSCQVKLLTEEEHLTSAGKIKGSGKPNVLANKFADQFSRMYAQIAKERPVYIELSNLYRHFAIAQTIARTDLPAFAISLIGQIRDRFEVQPVGLKKELPGQPNMFTFNTGKSIIRLPSCGGVGIEIPNEKIHLAQDRDGHFKALKGEILGKSNVSENLSWDFRYIPKLIPSQGLRSFNQAFNGHYYVIVSKNGPYITFNDGIRTNKYSLRKLSKGYADLARRLPPDTRQLIVELENFDLTSPKTSAFKYDLQHGVRIKKPILDVRFPQDKPAVKQAFREARPDLTNLKVNDPQLQQTGKYKGWYKTTIDFFVFWKNKLFGFKISFFTKDKGIGVSLRDYFQSRKEKQLQEKSILDLLEGSMDNLQKQLRRGKEEIIIEVESEVGDIRISLREPMTSIFKTLL